MFGDKEICLPKIDGYQECYTNPIVKRIADATEVPANTVLGFYLNNETYDKRDSLGLISFDDYFKVYATNELKNHMATSRDLDQMIQMLSDNFIKKNWDELSAEIDKNGLDIQMGIPIVVEEYRINDESFSMAMLLQFEDENMDLLTVATTINGYLKNDRLVWMAYYLHYEDNETISTLKQNSNNILQQLVDAKE